MSARCECGGGFVCGYCRRNSTGASLRAGFALGTPNGPAPRPDADLPPRTVAIEYLWAAEERLADLKAETARRWSAWSDDSRRAFAKWLREHAAFDPKVPSSSLAYGIADDIDVPQALVGDETTPSEATP